MLALLFLHVERPRPTTNYARMHTEWKWNGWHERVQRRLNGTEWNGSVTVFLTPTVYINGLQNWGVVMGGGIYLISTLVNII